MVSPCPVNCMPSLPLSYPFSSALLSVWWVLYLECLVKSACSQSVLSVVCRCFMAHTFSAELSKENTPLPSNGKPTLSLSLSLSLSHFRPCQISWVNYFWRWKPRCPLPAVCVTGGNGYISKLELHVRTTCIYSSWPVTPSIFMPIQISYLESVQDHLDSTYTLLVLSLNIVSSCHLLTQKCYLNVCYDWWNTFILTPGFSIYLLP